MRLQLLSLLAAVVVPVFAAHHSPHAHEHHAIALRNPAFSANSTSLAARNLTGVEEVVDGLGKRAFTNARFSYYAAGLGACGRVNSGGDFIVALNRQQFDVGGGYPAPSCFRKIRITYKGNSADATIVDRCVGCGYGGLDFTEGLFVHLAGSTRAGIIYGTWSFIGEDDGGGNAPPPPKPKPPVKHTSTHTPSTTTSKRPTTTHRPTSSSTHTSEAPDTTDTTPTSTSTTSSSSTPTPTETEPVVANLAGLLQAALGLTHLEEAAAIDTNAEAAA